MSGTYCDRCSVGTIGKPPNCIECGECFENWSKEIAGMSAELDGMERRTLDLFTFKGIENMGFFEFTSQLEEVENKINDLKRVFDIGYNLENVTRLFDDVDLLKSSGSLKRGVGLERLNELEAWNSSWSIFDKLKKEYGPIKKRTSFLLRKSFDLRETDVKGAITSILNSQKISDLASATSAESLNLIGTTISQISNDISSKLDDIKVNRTRSAARISELLREANININGVNQSILELNHAVIFISTAIDGMY